MWRLPVGPCVPSSSLKFWPGTMRWKIPGMRSSTSQPNTSR